MPTLRATSGVVLCRWRAARRRTGSHHKAHALAVNRANDCAANSVRFYAAQNFRGKARRVAKNERGSLGGVMHETTPFTWLSSSRLRRLTFDMSGSRRRRGLGPE